MKKILIGGLVLGSVILSGCSTSNTNVKLDKLTTDVGMLSQKVDAMQEDMKVMRQDINVTYQEAQRANQRLDNQVKTYRK